MNSLLPWGAWSSLSFFSSPPSFLWPSDFFHIAKYAITMLRTDPVDYLVVPRLIAMVVMAPVQCLFFFLVGLWSGQITSTALYNIPPAVFWTSVRTWMNIEDIPSMLLKALVFGVLIASISCGWGLTTKGGPKEVGTSTTGAVVMILITVSIMDVVLTKVLFG